MRSVRQNRPKNGHGTALWQKKGIWKRQAPFARRQKPSSLQSAGSFRCAKHLGTCQNAVCWPFSGGFAARRVEVRASVRRACGRRTGLRCCLGMRRGGATSRCRRESFSPDPVSSFGGGESRARGEFWPYASASPCRAVVLVRNCVLFAGSQCRSVRFAKAMWDPCGDARVCEVGQGRSEAAGRMRRATGRENEEAVDGLCEGARPPCRALASFYPGFSDGACAELVESVCKGGLQRYNETV